MTAYVILVVDPVTTTSTANWIPPTWTGSRMAIDTLAFPEVEEFEIDDKRARSRRAHAAAVLRGRKGHFEPKSGRYGFAQAYRLPCYRGVRTR